MSGRNILITGGSSGIGRAAVIRFAQAGDTVWFTYLRGAGRAAGLIAELAERTDLADRGLPPVRAFVLDQGDWDSHLRLAEALPGPVDVLVNNAAVGSGTVASQAADAPHLRDEAFLRINTLGPLWLIRQFAPGMEQRGYGKIVNVSSVGGGISVFPRFHLSDGISKASVVQLTRQLAARWACRPIDVFALCPGAVDTPMFDASTLSGLDAVERERFTAALPGGRLITPEEIAELAWWLCEPQAAALRGAVLDASLGLGSDPGALGRALDAVSHDRIG